VFKVLKVPAAEAAGIELKHIKTLYPYMEFSDA